MISKGIVQVGVNGPLDSFDTSQSEDAGDLLENHVPHVKERPHHLRMGIKEVPCIFLKFERQKKWRAAHALRGWYPAYPCLKRPHDSVFSVTSPDLAYSSS